MVKSKIIGGIAALTFAFTTPVFAKGTTGQTQSERAQSERTQSERAQNEQTATNQQRQTSQQRQASGLAGLSQDQVKQLQRQLQQRGLYDGDIDGIAGPKTTAAVSSFQVGRGIADSGQPDDETMAALGLNFERQPVRGAESPERRPAVGQTQGERAGNATQAGSGESQHDLAGLSSEQVRELQVRLQERGYYAGEIDGVAGPQTRAALRQFFQRQTQLVTQGKVTESALSAFGMAASEIEPVRGTENPNPQRE